MNNHEFISGKEASKILGVGRHTLYKYERENLIKTIRSPGGKRFYNVKEYLKNNNMLVDEPIEKEKRKICYARVSSHSQKKELENQKAILKQIYPDYELLYDIGSGINFKRKNFLKIIEYGINNELETLIVTYKDRLCRIGYELINTLLKNTEIKELYNNDKSPEEEVVSDLIEIITVFSSRVYGLRSYKDSIITNKENIIKKNP
ncbi:MAG: IS607 family transposase [Lutibacter sp.]|nr:IS607 family transposase [Lutibacter sp.]